MTTTIDDGAPFFAYTTVDTVDLWIDSATNATQRSMDASSLPLYHNGTYHTTCGQDNGVTLYFKGTGVVLYGAARSTKGNYTVSLDGGERESFDGYAPDLVVPFTLFTAAGLADGPHVVVLTNRPHDLFPDVGETCFGLDYADVDGTPLLPDEYASAIAPASSATPTFSTGSTGTPTPSQPQTSSATSSSSASSIASASTSVSASAATSITSVGASSSTVSESALPGVNGLTTGAGQWAVVTAGTAAPSLRAHAFPTLAAGSPTVAEPSRWALLGVLLGWVLVRVCRQ